MADTSFIVKNALVVNTSFTVNSTSLSYSGNNSFSGITLFTGNTVHSNNVIFNAGANVYANGSLGAAGQALVSNGSSVYWGTVVAGSNTQIQYNNSGQPAGSAGLTFNNASNTLSVSNSIFVGGSITVNSSANVIGNTNINGVVNITGGGGGEALTLYSGGDMWFYSAGNTNYAKLYCDNANEIRTDGNTYMGGSALVVGDVIANYSDERLKTIVAPIDNALDKVKALEGFYYTPNKKALDIGVESNQLSRVGVSAQQVQTVLPEAVKQAPIGHGYLTVQYEKLVPLLIEAIKELSAKVEANKCSNCSCGSK
jgi:Chaperone of endosialidase